MHFVIFVEQILVQLHDFQFMEVSKSNENLKQYFRCTYGGCLLVLNFCRPLDRLSSYQRISFTHM